MEDEPLEEDYFAHFGIKGMRWGVRRGSKGSLSSKIRTARDRRIHPRETRQARTTRRNREYLRKLPVKYLTNEELKSRLSRAKMEKELRDIEHENTQKARKVVQDVVQREGSKLVSEVVKTGVEVAKSQFSSERTSKNTISDGVMAFYNQLRKGL